MSFKKPFLLFLIALCSFSCNEDDIDCSTVDCAGPPFVGIEILLDGQNVFLNETYALEDVTLSGISNNDIDTFLSSFDSVDENSILFLNIRSFRAEDLQFTINLGNDFMISMVIATELSPSGGCCGGIPFLTNVQINGVQQDLSNPNGASFTINLN